jgi:hypothetical protein
MRAARSGSQKSAASHQTRWQKRCAEDPNFRARERDRYARRKEESNARRRHRMAAETPQERKERLARLCAWYAAHKEEVKARKRRQWAKDRELRRKRSYQFRKRRLKYQYGISIEDYDALLARQGGICAICKRKPGKAPLCVDHCHICHVVRGLLCHKCNCGIGYLEDDPRLLRAALVYLDGAFSNGLRPSGSSRAARSPPSRAAAASARTTRDAHRRAGPSCCGATRGRCHR